MPKETETTIADLLEFFLAIIGIGIAFFIPFQFQQFLGIVKLDPFQMTGFIAMVIIIFFTEIFIYSWFIEGISQIIMKEIKKEKK